MYKKLVWFLCVLSSPLFGQGNPDSVSYFEEEKKNKFYTTTLSSVSGENIDVIHYACRWKINPAIRYLEGVVRVSFKTVVDTASYFTLDFNNALLVDSVVFRAQKIQNQFITAKQIKINLGQTLNFSTYDSVSIFYKGIPGNSGFGAFNKQSHAGIPIIWTLSCPYAAGDWWPCKANLNDKADSIDLFISTPMMYRAAGNGRLISEIESGGQRRVHWKHKYPIATYLIGTAVTNYVTFEHRVQLPSQSGTTDSLQVLNFVYPESQSSAQINTPKVLPMLCYYDSLVAPYPFSKEKYGHAQFGWGGGMEHQTMSFMTDFSFSLQAHELAHQWFGNHITCSSWRDIWLNEGWATYMAALCEKRFGTTNFTNWLNSRQNSVKSQPGGSVWVSDTSDINRVFDYRLTYLKGALVLHMLRWQIGDLAFWEGVRNYQNDPSLKYGNASTNQFIQHLQNSSGQILTEFMEAWFKGQGYPIYNIQINHSEQNIDLCLNQTTSHPSVEFFKLKVPIRFRSSTSDTTIVFNHTQNGQVFNFFLPFYPDQITFDPEKWLIAKSSIQIISKSTSDLRVDQAIRTYPNPFKSTIWIENNVTREIKVRVNNLHGKYISTIRICPGITENPDFGNLPAGTYFLTCNMDGFRKILRIEKQ
jgi:aminopeptidase N